MSIDIDSYKIDKEMGITILSPLLIHEAKALNPDKEDYRHWLNINNVYLYERSKNTFIKKVGIRLALQHGADYVILVNTGEAD